MAQVRAEYDFEAQPNSGEMSIATGEVLTVIRTNIDGGWMEGRNARGSVGLFPESYVVPHVPSTRPLPPTENLSVFGSGSTFLCAFLSVT
ncbi:unnamed protein product [Caenorhabditis bovis]|uniref:SH3 domain-containing protein n=1 Tax=Caenorhabditis bovis TaxID=2654633 RepID=A0A8S1F729_9PELO|nr:unnamed protein product [Caenorhabditis bovis]